MASRPKILPAFEIYLKGGNVRPEDIPLTTLAQILSAIQRITSGASHSHHDGSEEDPKALRLLDIKRGSTTLPIFAPAEAEAIHNLQAIDRILKDPDLLGESDYIINCTKTLSDAARMLGCPITARRPGRGGELLAVFYESTYDLLVKDAYISGETSISGKVQRVGNATGARCGLHVPSLDRMIVCGVTGVELARRLGKLLYEDVVVSGKATWLKSSWKLVDFEIRDVVHLNKKLSFSESLEILREAGGDGWDKIDNPILFLEEMRK